MSGDDYYTELGLSKDATPDQIRRAYHEAARRLHPDVNMVKGETELFLRAQQAFEILSNPERRAEYDFSIIGNATNKNNLRISIQYSREFLPIIKEQQVVYILIEFLPPPIATNAFQEPPINLCLIIDRSTSMQGERLDSIRTATKQLIRKLHSKDIFSLVTFSDRAEVLLPAHKKIRLPEIDSLIHSIQPGGGTEILAGLEAGLSEVRRATNSSFVNHVILVTDGRTYGDEQACLQLADQAAAIGIGITCLGIGDEWNDSFLDELASRTGGNCIYVEKPNLTNSILEKQLTTLFENYANNVVLNYTKQPGIELTTVFRLSEEASPLNQISPIPLGNVVKHRALSIIFSFTLDPLYDEPLDVILLEGSLRCDFPSQGRPKINQPLTLKLSTAKSPIYEPPPASLIQAISRLNHYFMQERARQNANHGNVEKATSQLTYLAAQLNNQGEIILAEKILLEAANLKNELSISEESKKQIKYGTRSLLPPRSESTSS